MILGSYTNGYTADNYDGLMTHQTAETMDSGGMTPERVEQMADLLEQMSSMKDTMGPWMMGPHMQGDHRMGGHMRGRSPQMMGPEMTEQMSEWMQ